jgi:ubiquinone/menaquinone biosynthesis C-methylase UbiE
MNLQPGSRVREIGWGTGLNFSLVKDGLAEGQVVGLDLTAAVLDKARNRIRKSLGPTSRFCKVTHPSEPSPRDYSTPYAVLRLAHSSTPEPGLGRAWDVLRPGCGRLVILDVKYSRCKILNPFALWLRRNFGATDRR